MLQIAKVALSKVLMHFKSYVYADEYGVSTSSPDNTAAFNAAIIAAAAAGKILKIAPGIYKTVGIVNLGTTTPNAPLAITIEGTGATIEHYPTDDITDAMQIISMNAGRTIVRGLTIKGLQNGHTFGRDGIRIGKGDYPTLEDVTIENVKRDAVQIRPTVSNNWIENYDFKKVKVQTCGRDAFHFELSGSATGTFINQGTMDNCETRSVGRHTLMLQNDVTTSDSAQKISNLEISNMEFGAAIGSEAIIRLQGNPGVPPIENISIKGSAIEETSGKRSGWGVEITGKMSGNIRLDNNILFGLQPSKILQITKPCTTSGNITITIDGTGAADVYTVPVTTAANTPALVADVIAAYTYTNTHRATRSGVQGVTFWESDEVQFTFTVDFGTTGITADIITPGKIKTPEFFPMGSVQDVNSSAVLPWYSSHMPLQKRPRTGSLGPATGGAGTGGSADVHVLADNEIMEGWIMERFGNAGFDAHFHTVHKGVRSIYKTNLDMVVADGQGLFISTRCTADGTLTITLDTSNVFTIPMWTNAYSTPDLVADAISRATFTGYRVLRYNTQSIAFTKTDGTLPTLSVSYSTTGVTGSVTAQKLLRIKNEHTGTTADFEVFLRRAVKDAGT